MKVNTSVFSTAPAGYQKAAPITEIPLNRILPARWRGDKTTPAKVELAKERLQKEGFRGASTVRALSADDPYAPGPGYFERATAHNRAKAMYELGWETCPCQVGVYTDAEFYDIYLRDNSDTDTQATSWVINAVRSVPSILAEQYARDKKPLSQAYLDVQVSMGLKDKPMADIRDMVKRIDTGLLTPRIEEIVNVTAAIYTANMFEKWEADMDTQNSTLSGITTSHGPYIERYVRKVFERLQEEKDKEDGKPTRFHQPKKPKTLEDRLGAWINAGTKLGEDVRKSNEVVAGDVILEIDKVSAYLRNGFAPIPEGE